MQLKPLYRARFGYTGEWHVQLGAPDSVESRHFFLADGRCEGRINGRYRGANHAQRRGDGTYLPDFQGVIETDDGATILFDTWGYGRTYPAGRRQVVATITHVSDDPRYNWLNDVICVCVGEVRAQPDGKSEVVLDIAELIWEPIAE
jgi:hypothetical protein